MKSTISQLKILAGASCVLALAACDSIKDVEEKPSQSPPAQTVVLSGQINGLSSLRSITLQNNDDTINTKSFINAAPTEPNVGVRPVPFSFGSVAVGSSYNITIKDQPELKNCVVVNGQGVIALGVRPDVVVNCSNTGTRYSLTVNLPTTAAYFTGLQDAKVRLTTEEEIREVAVTPGQPTVSFNNVLIDAFGSLNPATWAVNATTFEDNRLNKCIVNSASGSNAGHTSTTVLARDINTPLVGPVGGGASACQFFVSGSVGYSQPAGTAYAPTLISGLKLLLRDLQHNPIQEITVADCRPTTANVTTSTVSTTNSVAVPVPSPAPAPGAQCSYAFTTPVRSATTFGVYDVAVSQQPTGQACIVVNGGSVSVFTQGTVAPANPQNVNVFCRATPAVNKQINGVFRLQSSTWVANTFTSAPMISTWKPFDFTVWNTASSNMLGFFKNGTFLYGTHTVATQVEQGFYDYDLAAQQLRFTLITDTNTSTVFPANFSPLPTIPVGATTTSITQLTTGTPGISATPNPIKQDGTSFAAAHAAMTGVTLGTANSGLGDVDTISGVFGNDPAGLASTVLTTGSSCSVTVTSAGVVTTVPCVDPVTGAIRLAATPATPVAPAGPATNTIACSVAAPCYPAVYVSRLNWVLQEVPQVTNTMSGGWLSEDGRRLWVWDYRTYHGTAVGMVDGSPSMNDACFTMEDLQASSGTYTRRGSGTGCYAFGRPANGQTPNYAFNGSEAVDYTVYGGSFATVIPNLPGYTGRIPGGEPAPGTTSPSPIYFQIAPAATFFNVASATYFPSASTAWCTTEILGLRSTANGYPINTPVYFCRTPFTP